MSVYQIRAQTICHHLSPPLRLTSGNLARAENIMSHLTAGPKEPGYFRKKFRNIVQLVMKMFSRDPQGKVVKNTKILTPGDWVEFFDPLHRRPHNLKWFFTEWKTTPELHTKMSYWDYMREKQLSCPEVLNPAFQVQYFTPEERARYRISITPNQKGEGVVVSSDGKPLETGTYLVVLGPDYQLYAAKEVRGKLHHSSFFGGKSVLAPGEIGIEGGILKKFAGLSGHYKPDKPHDENFVKHLRRCGIDPKTYQYLDPVQYK